MCIELPLCTGVFVLALCDADVRISLAVVCGELAEQQDVFRAANAHLGAVLALFGPSQSVSLIIFSHDVGHDGDHAEIGKAVLDKVGDAVGVKRFDSRHSHAGDVAKLDAVFDVDCSHATGLQSPQQLRRQIVHLLKECVVVGVMAKIVVRGRILVMVAERDTCHIQVDAVGLPVLDFLDAIVVDCGIALSGDFHALTSYRSFEGFQGKAAKAVFFDDLLHLLAEFVILTPLALQGQQDLRFSVHV